MSLTSESMTGIGFLAAYYMEHHGHYVTGMNNQVVWGMPHVFAIFLIVLLGVPFALRKKLANLSPAAAQVAELAGILGAFAIVLASLMLAAVGPVKERTV